MLASRHYRDPESIVHWLTLVGRVIPESLVTDAQRQLQASLSNPEEYERRRLDAWDDVDAFILQLIAKIDDWDAIRQHVASAPSETWLFFFERWVTLWGKYRGQNQPVSVPTQLEAFLYQELVEHWQQMRPR